VVAVRVAAAPRAVADAVTLRDILQRGIVVVMPFAWSILRLRVRILVREGLFAARFQLLVRARGNRRALLRVIVSARLILVAVVVLVLSLLRHGMSPSHV
jgi:hypothetical protein